MPKMTRGLVIRDCTITRLSRARMVESRRKDVVRSSTYDWPDPGDAAAVPARRRLVTASVQFVPFRDLSSQGRTGGC